MAKRKKINRRRKVVEEVERPRRVRRYQYYFLIVCEDEKTEPAYFEQFKEGFPERTMYLECVGTGRDPLGVVEQSLKEKEKLEEIARKTIDHTWVVFDKDDADQSEGRRARFDAAFALAETEGIKLAFSNEVFELWLLLHLEEVSGEVPIPRMEIYERLGPAVQALQAQREEPVDFAYEHGDTAILAAVAEYGSEAEATARAIKLREQFTETHPIESNPSTGVDLLVAELRGWIRFYA